MARLGTPNLGLGTWLDGEAPGAGSQTVASLGLNGNWLLLDAAVGVGHNADGSHKANVIKGSNLVQSGGDSCVDGVGLEFSSNKIRLKDNGVPYAKIQQISATARLLGRKTAGAGNTEEVQTDSSLEIDSSAGLRIKALGVGTSHLAANSVTAAKIPDAEITTAKLEYKEYVALLSQAGTADPVATVLKNTLGVTPTWSRQSAGQYIISVGTSATFTANKTAHWTTTGGTPCVTQIFRFDANTIYIGTFDDTLTVQDSKLDRTQVVIRVYP